MPQIVVTLADKVVSTYVFDKDIVSIGRARDNDVVIENRAVSRGHARIRREGDDFILTDLNSANGVFVNGERVMKTRLQHDDVVTIGKHKLIFKQETIGEKTMIAEAYGAERTILVEKMPAASLVFLRGQQREQAIPIEKAEVTLGSSRDADVCISEWFVSKIHAVIHRQGREFLLRDAGSWRGTKVNDAPVTQWILKNGDEIQIGGARLRFQCESEDAVAGLAQRLAPDRSGPTERVGPTPERVSRSRQIEAPPEPLPPREEEEPQIRAGGAEDFIEPTIPPAPEVVAEAGVIVEEAIVEEKEAAPRVIPATPPPPRRGPTEASRTRSSPTVREGPADATAGSDARVVEIVPAPIESVESSEQTEGAPPVAGPEMVVPTHAPPKRSSPTVREGPKARQKSTEELDEIRMWEQALKNKSAIIRKQAAKMLKKITGKDYDY